MKIRPLILQLLMALVAVFAGANSYAGAGSSTVTVTAFGNTSDLAVSNALVEAVRQTNGVSVSLDPDIRRPITEWTLSANADGALVTGYSTLVPEPQAPTLGGIRSYHIDQLSMIDSRTWKAVITAEALVHKRVSTKPADAPTIVIEPFSHAAAAVIVDEDGSTADLDDIAARLQSDLMSAVASGSSYRVLDRTYAAAAAREQAISASSLDPQEQIKRAKALGADALLVGQIDRVSVVELQSMAYGDPFLAFTPRISVVYRLIEVATGEVLATTRYEHIPTQSERTRIRQVVSRHYPNQPVEHVYQMFPAVTSAMLRTIGATGAGPDSGSHLSQVGFDHLVSRPARSRTAVVTPGSGPAPIAW